MSALLRRLAAQRVANGVPTVVVEVVASRGSVPREDGTRMLVGRGDCDGTVGGGKLEWRAIATARRMLDDAAFRPHDEVLALGASLGQCCGGAVTLRYRVLDAASLAAWTAASPVPTIQVYGAGHVGRAVVHVLSVLDVDVTWIDERDGAFPVEASAPNVRRACVDAVEAEADTAPAGAFHLVMTHSHDLDLRIVAAILERDNFAWLGLIGSQTKGRRFAQLLAARGVPWTTLERMRCPIGQAGLGGKEPAHIAIAVAAELLPLLSIEAAGGAASGEVLPSEVLGVPARE